jgi:anti-anti-sigma factor
MSVTHREGQNDEHDTAELADVVSKGMVSTRCSCGCDNRCGHHPKSYGLCHDRRPAGSGRPLYGISANGDLWRCGHLAGSQRDHDHDHRNSRRGRTGRSGVRRTEFIWALVAFAGVVLVGTLKGILVAIIVSLVALAYQVANPPVHIMGRKRDTNVFRPRSAENPDDEEFSGLLILRVEGRVFFANAEQIAHKIKPLVDQSKPRVVILDMSGVPDLEYTALKTLTGAEKRNREQGIRLWLVGMNPQVLAMVRKSQLGTELGEEGMHFNLEMAVAKYLAMKSETVPAR